MDLVGRKRELEMLVDRLRERRLVTVIGPGGIGKTALAAAVAARATDDFELGSRWVDLVRVASDDPDDVGDALAAQLGHPSFTSLLDTPVDPSVLLVIDNCEHVCDATAEVVDRLLQACAAPTVLATSRSPLDLPGEVVVPLGPLEVPRPGVIDGGAEAVRLFRERAADAGRPVGEDGLEPVCELCRYLDGIPLAIEIAAARTRSLTPAEILAHLDDQLDFLARPRHRGPSRHRSLRTTIDWSYGLLDPGDRTAFERLSVFAGPFTLDMAHAVASEPGDKPTVTLARLDALVASSLVMAEPDTATTWYRLLESLRAFATERLRARGELRPTAERFVAHAVAVARAIVDAQDSAWEAAALSRLVGLYDNLAAAVRWCLANDDEPDRALLLVAVMWGVVHQARTAEIADLGGRVLHRWSDPSAPLWADAAATVATAQHLLGDRDAAGVAEQGLAATGSSLRAPVTLRRVLALTRRAAGDVAGARDLFVDAAARARALGADAMAIELDTFAAEAVADLGDPDTALDQLRRCADDAVRYGSDVLAVWARTVEGHLLLRIDPRAATSVIEETLAEARRIGYPAGIAASLCALALDRLLGHRPAEAAAITLELLDELAVTGAVALLRTSVEVAATVLRHLGRSAWVDLSATAATLPPRGGLARELPPALWPPAGSGRVLAVRDAVALARRELRDDPGQASAEGVRSSSDRPRAVFRRADEFWEVDFGDRSAHLRASKGMDDLARLLAEPGREIHCLELADASVEEPDTGEVIDAAARRAYERRVRELQAEIDDADADHDLGRAERARTELDALVDQLATTLGLGQRSRRGPGTAERARSAVTQRIRSTIRRIGDAHPRLGRHLRAAIRTGTYCSYEPEETIDWDTSPRGGRAVRGRPGG